MTNFPVGLTVLVVVSVLIYLGIAHRVLDRLRLSDRGALVIIVAMIIGSFISIPLATGPYVTINVGGALIPLILVVYLLAKAGTGKERLRALVASIVTAAVVFVVGTVVMSGVNADPRGRYEAISSLWIAPLVAGLTAYIAGRSRRASFIAAVLGLLVIDAGYYIWLFHNAAPAGRVDIGGAGFFDGIVLAGITAVLLAEIVGEIRERLQGGPEFRGRPVELMEALRKPLPGKDTPPPAGEPLIEKVTEKDSEKGGQT